MAYQLDEKETMIYRVKYFDEVDVDNVNCAPFVKPSDNHFFDRWIICYGRSTREETVVS